MSLELLSYDYIGRFVTPAVTVSGTMAAIQNGFQSTTYSDGSARSPGSGIAWTAAVETSAGATVSLSLTPATSSLGQKAIITGGGTGTPTMISPDTYANTRLYVGLCKNAGAYTSWANANPFSSGQYSGLTSFTPAVSAVHIYESKDTLALFGETSVGAVYIVMMGALLDPESTDPLAAESDGKRYCIFTSGAGAVGGTPNLSTNFGTNSFLGYTASALAAHCYIMNIGASATTTACRNNVVLQGANAASFKNAAGEFVRLPIYLQGLSTSNFWFGRIREVLTFTQSLAGTKFTVSNVTKGFVIGANTTATSECILLRKS
jgi:hypothetical protein